MGKARRIRRAKGIEKPYEKPPEKAKASPAVPKASSAIFKFNTSIGQHVLKNASLAEAIVDKAGLHQSDTVLEVGPGTGILTTHMLEKAKKVVGVELDPRMAAELSKRVQGTPMQQRLQLVLGDFIKTDMSNLPHFNVCISNTPYQISSPLVFKLLALPRPPRTCILMVQREFALRLIARPGDALYSRLSVNVQFFARVSHVMKFSRKNFTPPPQVDSSVVRIEPKPDRPAVSWDEWDGMLRICFVRKNKTLRASWTASKVRALVESNWITWASTFPEQVAERDVAALSNEQVQTGAGEPMDVDPAGLEDGEDVQMADVGDEDDGVLSKRRGGALNRPSIVSIGSVRAPRAVVSRLVLRKIDRILDSTGLGKSRASKCDENDFLRLLYACNAEGIHFS